MTGHNVAGPLTAADFPAFLAAVHKHQPFPWQTELVRQVLDSGEWPDLTDIPTGLGKTTMIDVAVFVAAISASNPGAQRVGRRRCFFVVDRRLVVDEAERHAIALSGALAAAEKSGGGGVVGRVAVALRGYAPDAGGEVLPVTKMRGGATWAASWLDRPDRPGVILGTVDQVGSRLLFRGYGVSDRRKPIDAALVGTDALVLVDEAHLSKALLTTVRAAQQRDRFGVALPGLSVVRLSATDADADHPFVLDVESHRPNEEAWRRLTAAKRLSLVSAQPKDCVKAMAQATVERMSQLAERAAEGVTPAVLVVCNTVDRARAVHDHLTRQFRKTEWAGAVDCDLLIGRARPIDRVAHRSAALEALGVGRPTSGRPAVLVATQTVEVGVNLDADALVTESASWDALVQRLGRLNRLGRFAQRYPGVLSATATVVHDGQEDGPVYGTARDATWTALHEMVSRSSDGILDVSPLACRELGAGPLGDQATRKQPDGVPVLLRSTLDAWTQTAPIPLNDPPVAPYLHGFDSGRAPVQVLWRDRLLSGDALDDPFDDGGAEQSAGIVASMLAQFPPQTAETVEVPWYAVRQWMLGQTTDAVSDLESEPEPANSRTPAGRDAFRVLAQRPSRTRRREPDGDSEWQWTWITADQLRPADQIIVPTERGGLDRYGWAPQDETTVTDVSEPAAFQPHRSRRPAALRLDGLAVRLHLDKESREALDNLVSDLDPQTDFIPGGGAPADRTGQHDFANVIAGRLPAEPPPGIGWPPEAWERLRRWLTTGKLAVLDILDNTDPVADRSPVVAARLLIGPVDAGTQPDRDDEEAAASSIGRDGRQVTLDQHHAAVRERSRQIAEALQLPDDLRQVIEDAAGWHDLGKADERFQIMLHGGDRNEAAIATETLAKSGMNPTDRQAWRRSARLSGLPRGARPEAWSAALVTAHLREHPPEGDADLLIHLVAAHHGYARPLARLVVDPDPREVVTVVAGHKTVVDSHHTVDLTQPTRFAQLNHRYGRWGLALLETIVRCADMTVSEEGS